MSQRASYKDFPIGRRDQASHHGRPTIRNTPLAIFSEHPLRTLDDLKRFESEPTLAHRLPERSVLDAFIDAAARQPEGRLLARPGYRLSKQRALSKAHGRRYWPQRCLSNFLSAAAQQTN
ncbi:hypothetical protein [Hydrogenophaga sp. PAMC20947]|uniref:hypothetical protein n=1 Tax=Hydrogenophaga sp. PAMC20947 TaxID=2565558 RepID=UPI00109D921D|nr:hypothetical protein [Hydrogenophaga sp. PAMC20947]QCB46925.1 hypothetical protein E5678_13370 [Hydrogenophaga sp. PAMC20947]